jgi:hypothetical protein
MKFAIFDIDHTIARSHWRDAMKPPNNSWDEYHAACIEDKPNSEIVDMIDALHDGKYVIIGMTRRPEKFRHLTMQWMIKHQVKLNLIYMADNHEYRNGSEVKIGMIEEHFTEPNRRDIALYIDDDPEICSAITEKFGITTLNVRSRIRQ